MDRATLSTAGTPRHAWQRPWRLLVLLLSTILILMPLLATPVGADPGDVNINSATFSGAAYISGPPYFLYASTGVTLTVVTDTSGGCVRLSGGFSGSLATPTSSTATTKTWVFNLTTPAAGGVGSVTITAYNNNNCTNNSHTSQTTRSYTIVIRPTLTATVAPVPNAGGWNNSNATVTLTASANGGGSVVSITYSASGAQTIGSTTVPGNSATVTINTEGTTVLTATAQNIFTINSLPATVTIKLDKSAPSISGSRTPTANANGWNNADVTASFTCSDAISGIASCTAPITVTTEGAGQSANGTATDNAGNTASATVSGINIDKTAPTLSGAPTTSPNGAGWYNGDVTIAWTCADALSGIDGACPADSTITGEGSGLTASASVADQAGNSATATSTPAVNIDRTAPLTGHDAPGGWNNATVTVNLTASDGLSGVAATYYTVDGGATQTGTAATISGEGTHTLSFWSVDNAGNTEATQTVQVKIDLTAPTISHTQSPVANGNGWNNAAVTVTFTCDDPLSGIASCTAPITVATEGQNQAATGTAVDNAGNSATDPATVSIDLTAPTIGGSATPAPNGNGWNNGAVAVSFTCSDALSGIDTCAGATTLTTEGAGQSATGTATDNAGNTASATVSGINIDLTAPTIGGAPTTAPNGAGWYNGDVVIDWTCADTLSGLDGTCPADSTITGEGASLSATASVADQAGNSASATVAGIKIDRTVPSTSASVPAPPHIGSVTVTLTATDGLSGIAATYYTIDGGATQTYSGPFSLATGGTHTVSFWSVDNAGNAEDGSANSNQISLTVDNNVITFDPLADRTLGGAPFTVSAYASSGLQVTFTAGPPGVCTISGTTVTLVGTGTCTITANQAGDSTHNAADPVSRSFTVNPSPVQDVLLTVNITGGGTVSRNPVGTGSEPGPFAYPPGTLVTLTPVPNAGQTFIGWSVDGTYQGWPKPMDITMNAAHTVVANFVTTKTFNDVGAGRGDYTAIVELASRSIIRGYNSTTFAPDNSVKRNEMAALIARAMSSNSPAGHTLTPPACLVVGTWDCEDWGNTFTDPGGDPNLWRNVGTLQHYGVANGYDAATCALRGLAVPCFGTNDPVTYAQTISFITRAMKAQGYWTDQPGGPLPPGVAAPPAAHAADVRTFYYYTQGEGGFPGFPAGKSWNDTASRGWFAQALWQALNSYFRVDRVP